MERLLRERVRSSSAVVLFTHDCRRRGNGRDGDAMSYRGRLMRQGSGAERIKSERWNGGYGLGWQIRHLDEYGIIS